MRTMMDEIFDRNYQQGRAELNAGIDRAIATVAREFGKTLAVLHRIEWNAPWDAPKANTRRARGASQA